MKISTKAIRTGGRSAKIQKAVYEAVDGLLKTKSPNDISVYEIAELAGVPPSTIYRRWGDVNRLLADVAVKKLHPETIPKDLGSYEANLREWVEQYYEEMSSPTGVGMLREIVYVKAGEAASKCTSMIGEQLDQINTLALNRNEKTINNDLIINFIVSPIIFHILFDTESLTKDKITEWVDALLTNSK